MAYHVWQTTHPRNGPSRAAFNDIPFVKTHKKHMHLPETTMSGSGSWMPGYNTSTNRYTLAGTGYDSKGELLNDTFHIADIVRDRDFSALTLENVPNLLSFIDLPNL